MKLWKKSLMARLVGYFLLLSLVTVSLVGYVAFIRAREALKQSVFDRLDAVATLKEDELNRWADDQRRDVVFIAWLPELRVQAGSLLSHPKMPESGHLILEPRLSSGLRAPDGIPEIRGYQHVGLGRAVHS